MSKVYQIPDTVTVYYRLASDLVVNDQVVIRALLGQITTLVGQWCVEQAVLPFFSKE